MTTRAIWILSGGLLALAALPLHAQERRPVPDRAGFLAECVPPMAQVAGSEPGGEAFARAACACSHQWLSDRDTMSREEFDAAATLCRAEFERDTAGFMQRYGD